MNPHLDQLRPYPFENLARLLAGVKPPRDLRPISLAMGEPRHATPELMRRELGDTLEGLAKYPPTRGGNALRESICEWLTRRFELPQDCVDPASQVLTLNGTREGLFAFAQCVVDSARDALVLMPNPFYQIYEGAALLAGAQPYYLDCNAENGWLPDFEAVPPDIWRRCQLLYICSPGNPSGAVLDELQLQGLVALAEKYDFVLAADECYAEIYVDESHPPPSLLGAAYRMGNTLFERCVVFHSLSKRSNAPGLRSGFVAGDARIIAAFLQYRTYHGCAMSLPVQAASTKAWRDEDHVRENRRLYREKFDAVVEILAPALNVKRPAAGFYLWPRTPIDDQTFARELFLRQHVTVLPGSYISRSVDGRDPGHGRVRMALVAPLQECVEAARRIRSFVQSL